ncbi:putative phospholipase [Paramyrothecium foliicola]|nr:putative phospholipase [Paramyrothecium foliicola]
MSVPTHTFGAKCRLAPVLRPEKDDGMPPIEAQFFYSSVIPIDDPLSTGAIIGGSDAKSQKGQLRPFPAADNNALEKAWLGLSTERDRQKHRDLSRAPGTASAEANAEERSILVDKLAARHWDKHQTRYKSQEYAVPVPGALSGTPSPACCGQLFSDVCEEIYNSFCSLARNSDPYLSPEIVVQEVTAALEDIRRSSSKVSHESTFSGGSAVTSKSPPAERSTGFQGLSSSSAASDIPFNGRMRSRSLITNSSSRTQTPVGSAGLSRLPANDDGISGMPFVRVGSPEQPTGNLPSSFPSTELPKAHIGEHDVPKENVVTKTVQPGEVRPLKSADRSKEIRQTAEIAVGISRLHMVSLPKLQMKPIYWSPINDMAAVMRATWFYRDTMLPVPPVVANLLENGYQELRPWTETWSDEIRCAIEVGSAGEEKLSHRLWPKGPGMSDNPISADPFCAARCCQGDAATEGSIHSVVTEQEKATTDSSHQPFSTYHVIYKNDSEAFLLKPSLKPSAYYGRKPLQKIMKGFTIGISVVRGFDRQAWDQIHQNKQSMNAKTPVPNRPHEDRGHNECEACAADTLRGQVSDLILVAHGIGQKFAERVESFHFTHAINGFRRAVNTEYKSPAMQSLLRDGHRGLMILPLNWRLGLSFEDGGTVREEDDKANYAPEGFGLKDIEPNTIPAVRSMISDVMFDIPFYLSHHKGKMIKALVSEANRVYRLWCRNNPGFAEKGRVHLIGHSLGSAMALEILSRQPTTVPRLNLSHTEPETRFLEFDTKNLFLVGSPAGFFLLLEKGVLMPRRGRLKPGADPGDEATQTVAGEEGTFGCLAVDNIYNILAKEDPIAYLLNGAVDPIYSASLKKAYVPSAATSLLKSVGDTMRSIVPGMAPPTNPLLPEPERPVAVRLPSQLELEVHDFTREEIAEKKAFLLNDNGQIDWYLKSGGGPLELQYLNMLSAHTSYWTNQDFIRMLCIEIGRKPGRANTVPALRAVKATKRMVPTSNGN